MRYRLLPPSLKPLADKFYRSQRSAMRAHTDGQIWVAQRDEVIASLCLRSVEHGLWLTGLLVAPAWRNQGIARQLLAQALAGQRMPVWLFCQPELQPFYACLGFSAEPHLPEALQQRLHRYQRTKRLIAMGYEAN